MQKLLIFIVSFTMFVGCTTAKKPLVTDFPTKPTLTQYKTPPVIKKEENNFVVTPELIENATLLTDYSKRIDTWKLNNNIR